MKTYFKYLIIVLCCCTLSCEKGDDPATDESTTTDPIDPVDPADPQAYQQYGTPFTQLPDTEDIVMYEVNLRAMSTAGTLQGVTNKLDHIKSLGVNMIWLMPIHPQGVERSVGSPYAVRDYKAVGAEYGNLQDLRNLTDAAHARGMGVMMDWVANHTAWDNAWIQNKSWYTQDASGNIVIPAGTNWQDLADLNYGQQDMRKAMIDAMKYWVYEANIDGYRCDYANGVPADFWKQAWNELATIPNRSLVKLAEGDRADHLTSGFDLSFGFKFYGGIKTAFEGQPASRIFSEAALEYANAPSGRHYVRYTTNHDESAWDKTPIQVFGGKQGALAASAITIFMEGVPLIYSSQEVGRANNLPFFSKSTIDFTANPELLARYQQMLSFYTGSNTARKGSLTTYTDADVAVFKKVLNGKTVLVVANIRDRQINYSIPAAFTNSTWKNIMEDVDVTLGSELTLQPYQFYILDAL